MVQLPKPLPQLFRAVPKPSSLGTRALAQARPVYIDGLPEGGGDAVTWTTLTGKPATFPPTVGTTATTAKAGNYVPAWGDVTGKPATFSPTIGATAATAAAGNHNHPVTADAASGLAAATTVQALAVALSARIKALEDATP